MSFLSIRGVRKSFGDNDVIRGMDLEVEKGELVCLIGASGSGKSTLLRCINLLDPLDDGEIFLDGVDIAEPGLDPRPVRQRVGMVFQSYNLFPHMTAVQNVMLAPRRVKSLTPAQLGDPVRALFRRFGLESHMDKYPDALSGGQQQRVAIIRALAMDPDILLLDEITSALDPELVGEVLDVLRQLRGDGMTMILATHEMSFAREVADKVCFLNEGQILESGTPAQIFTAPTHDRTRSFLARVL